MDAFYIGTIAVLFGLTLLFIWARERL